MSKDADGLCTICCGDQNQTLMQTHTGTENTASSVLKRDQHRRLCTFLSEAGRGSGAGGDDLVSSSSTLLQKKRQKSPSRHIPVLSSWLSLPNLHCSSPCFFLILSRSHPLLHRVRLETVQTRRRVLEEISSPKSRYMHKKRVP